MDMVHLQSHYKEAGYLTTKSPVFPGTHFNVLEKTERLSQPWSQLGVLKLGLKCLKLDWFKLDFLENTLAEVFHKNGCIFHFIVRFNMVTTLSLS